MCTNTGRKRKSKLQYEDGKRKKWGKIGEEREERRRRRREKDGSKNLEWACPPPPPLTLSLFPSLTHPSYLIAATERERSFPLLITCSVSYISGASPSQLGLNIWWMSSNERKRRLEKLAFLRRLISSRYSPTASSLTFSPSSVLFSSPSLSLFLPFPPSSSLPISLTTPLSSCILFTLLPSFSLPLPPSSLLFSGDRSSE
mmetsp:Transcript_14354/g.36615  ORF Transcript_14354/g.36615 Transcript_14354/m.36615 type:complete len:201 (-) Transcript_14354:1808-2410(-)